MAGISRSEREQRDRLLEQGLKQCNTCGETKPLDAYRPRPDGYRGLNGSCNVCTNASVARWQKTYPDKAAAKVRRWAASNRERARTNAKRYRDSVDATCAIDGCEDTAVSHAPGALCPRHRNRVTRHGDPHKVLPMPSGPDHPRWVGDNAGYGAAHARIRAARGKASEYVCAAECGRQAEHWSYRGGAPDERTELVSGLGRQWHAPYSLDFSFYDALCRGCHTKRDVWKKDVLTHAAG